MKLSNEKFRSFLNDIIEKRMDKNKEESHMLQELLEEMDQLPNEEVAEKWLNILRLKAEDIITIRDIVEKEDIHRNNVAKITYDITELAEIKKEVNLLPGIIRASGNFYLKDAYELWKMIRQSERYPEGAEIERDYILKSLPESEKSHLK